LSITTVQLGLLLALITQWIILRLLVVGAHKLAAVAQVDCQ
jgi:hypothetical protein